MQRRMQTEWKKLTQRKCKEVYEESEVCGSSGKVVKKYAKKSRRLKKYAEEAVEEAEEVAEEAVAPVEK